MHSQREYVTEISPIGKVYQENIYATGWQIYLMNSQPSCMEGFLFCILFVVHVFLHAVREPLEQKNHPDSILNM